MAAVQLHLRRCAAILQAAGNAATLVAAVDNDGNTPLDLAMTKTVQETLQVSVLHDSLPGQAACIGTVLFHDATQGADSSLGTEGCQ